MLDEKTVQDNTISADEVCAEWHKDPDYRKAYDSLEEEFAEIYRQIRAKDARLARQKARRAWLATQLAQVREALRGGWHWLLGGRDRVTT